MSPPPQSLGPSVFSWSVWAEQHLSGGVFEFRSLRITRDAGEGREAGGGGVALALHKHRVQACDFGSKESMNAVEHRKEVGELQLLRDRKKERRAEFSRSGSHFAAGRLGVYAKPKQMGARTAKQFSYSS